MPTLVLDRAAELKSTLSFCEILFCPEDARRAAVRGARVIGRGLQ